MHKIFVKLNYSFVILLPILFMIFLSAAFSQTHVQCTEQLNKAQQEYDLGNFEKAIELIQPCLKNPDVSEGEKGRGYRLLGLVYIGQQLVKEANEAVKNLLLMVPNYKINPETDPPQLKRIIDDMTLTLEPRITSITPNNADQEGNGFTIKVYGTNFVYGSIIKFNGAEKITTHVSAFELKAEIPAIDLLEDGEFDVNVYSPISGGRKSNTEKFKVVKASSFPWTWIAVGGGAVAAVVVAIIVSGGNGKDEIIIPPILIADPPTRP